MCIPQLTGVSLCLQNMGVLQGIVPQKIPTAACQIDRRQQPVDLRVVRIMMLHIFPVSQMLPEGILLVDHPHRIIPGKVEHSAKKTTPLNLSKGSGS